MFWKTTYPFVTTIFHFSLRVKSFGDGMLNYDLLSFVKQINHVLLLRYRFVELGGNAVEIRYYFSLLYWGG